MRVVTEEAWVWHAVFVAVVVLLLVDLVVVFSVVNLSQDAAHILLHPADLQRGLRMRGEAEVAAGQRLDLAEVSLPGLELPVAGEVLLQGGLRGEEGVAHVAPELLPGL